ncbi:eukaryotic translation initiation factor 3 subunit A isoform X2 [Olea europaea var. sylvestris]|uniref:Eukaryotic translation initiation factor 3 subunit A n=1 Tax=Olea europaea subsp. europaea TaxID=158383 RepID=A0A8S0RXG6_OLEEU|nr:eukaryotic translation initiation factor 3 subunit A isoform X2 [Olea europaea var. sylvestris]CAA2984865.1 eukaryotic translation initiation factor 3 subunit A-like [Olea europaea subsp. europaea]
MATFARPENALKRAEELINVGQKQEALEALHSFITSRRYRAWTKTHEKILFKYVDLCVDLRRGRHAKDGLIQYRSICQQVNINSLEEVIKHFMQLATERAELARSQAQALEEALDVDDLEADKRPEDLMLSYVSGEKGKDRSDRELVTPWFKFLWETYRSVLEILRNNSRLEALYAMTAHRAFQFCKQYKRTTEFRRLCEIIRNHLANLNKYRDQRDRPDLAAPESLQLYLDTRFEQLKIATELELWQEAFRSIEDIHGLMCMVKKTPKPSLMVVYYAKQSEIFWISSNHIYHAYCWLKLFSLQKSFNKNLSQKDLQLIASSVVLAALSVPPFDQSYGASHMELENEKERRLRVASLIAFDVEPKPENREVLSRASLFSELASKGVMTCVTQEVKDLYNILEHEFLPLDLAIKAQPLLTKISKLGGKLSSASSVPEVRLSSSVPEVRLSQYVPALEKLANLRLLQQNVESEGLRDHLATFAESVSRARIMIYPPVKSTSKLGETLSDLVEVVEKEHKRLLARKSIIEKRKEEQERQHFEMEREEEAKRQKLQKITEEAEQRRLASEFEQMKNQRILREIEERELEEAQALLLEAEKRRTKRGKKPVLEGEKITKQHLMELALTEQLRERQEMEKKIQKLAKTLDYFERAKRDEAAPLIEAAYQLRLAEEEALHEREQKLEIELSRQRHAGDLEEKRRLSRMLENKRLFQASVVSRRETEFNRIQSEREERINQIIQSRKQEREAKRKMIYYLRSEEERQKRLLEEEEARKREEMERKKKEEAERKAKLDEIAEKQRQRERELEEKERQRREELLGRSNAVPARHTVPSTMAHPAEAAPVAPASAAASPAKYVPRFKRTSAEAGVPAPPPETDKWTSGRSSDDQTSQQNDRWRDDRRSAFGGGGGGGPRSTWSSRNRG